MYTPKNYYLLDRIKKKIGHSVDFFLPLWSNVKYVENAPSF